MADEPTPEVAPEVKKHPATIQFEMARARFQDDASMPDEFHREIVLVAAQFARDGLFNEAVNAVCYIPPEFYEQRLFGLMKEDHRLHDEVIWLARALEAEGIEFIRPPPEIANKKVGLA